MSATLEKLKTILVRDYRVDPLLLTPDATLETLGIDSLGTVELLWTVEEEFGIKLPGDLVDLPNVAAVASYIDSVIATQAAGTGRTVDAQIAAPTR